MVSHALLLFIISVFSKEKEGPRLETTLERDVLLEQEQQGLSQFLPLEGSLTTARVFPVPKDTVKPFPNPECERTLACAFGSPTAAPGVGVGGYSACLQQMRPESDRRRVDTGSPAS